MGKIHVLRAWERKSVKFTASSRKEGWHTPHERKVRTRCDIMVRQRGQLVTLSGGTGIDEEMDSDDERM